MGQFNLGTGVLQEQKTLGFLQSSGRHAIVENKKVSGDILKLLKIIPC